MLQEISLWRKGDRTRKSVQIAAVATPTANGESGQVLAFDKDPSPEVEDVPEKSEENEAE